MKILGFEIGRSRADDAVVVPVKRQHIARGVQKRSFQSGVTDRLTSKWTVADQTVNQSLLKNLRAMRARSRDFAKNNEYGRKFFGMVRANVVGSSGFTLKVNCLNHDGSCDHEDSKRIRQAYLKFAKPGNFDVTGKLSETMFDMLAMTMIARDGEVLVRKVTGNGFGVHGCQLQLLSAHLLDEEHNMDLAGGNRIRMGVEFNRWMKPIAYHLRIMNNSADMHGTAGRRYERVSADEMLHLFVPEEVDQWRGVPWPFAALRSAKHLDEFQESAQVNARVGAGKMGFFQQNDPEAGAPMGVDDEGDESGYGEEHEFIDEAEPGTFNVIPDGYEFAEFNPSYPNDVYDPFVKSTLRTMAMGLLVSAHGLSGDLTDVNFSSIRSGTLDEREMWRVIQNWYIDAKKMLIFPWWLTRALMNDADLKKLPFTKFEKYDAAEYFGRGWDWVDPRNDMLAAKEGVALGVKSRASIIRANGRDPEDVWDELDAENERGFSAPAAPTSAAKRPPPEDED